jgi:hypothetical protein
MMVAYTMAEKTKATVVAKGIKSYTLKKYPIGHTVGADEIQDVHNFLVSVLPPDDSCRIKLKEPSEMSVKELKAAIRKAGLSQQAVGLMEKHEFVKLLQHHRSGSS